jgi:mono/diheme cytochrome c family protein
MRAVAFRRARAYRRAEPETIVRTLPFPLLGCALLLGACQPAAAPETAAPARDRGLAFAQGSCGGCHAVERGGLSPNPGAPPFAAIVNQPGLTRDTLGAWLRDAHNYPEEMEFYLVEPEVDALVAYMLTLRGDDYRPAI